MFVEVGSFEAKTKLPELLRSVQQGGRFTITVRGEPVADLVPSGEAPRANVRQAIAAMRDFRVLTVVDDVQLKAYRESGRK